MVGCEAVQIHVNRLSRRGAATVLLAVVAACGQEGGDAVDPSLIHTVRRGDIQITVRERGEIRAARDTRISSQLEGRATLIYLIPEGTVVKGGEKVAELDVSPIEEKRAQQAINVAKAEAALEQARKNVEIAEKELKAADRTAETRLEIARLQLAKFIGQNPDEKGSPAAPEAIDDGGVVGSTGTNAEMVARLRELLDEGIAASASGSSGAHLIERVLEILGSEENLALEMGEMANQILQQIDKISLARADLNLAEQTLSYSRKLAEKGFITSNELDRDEINYKRQLSTQTVAWNELLLLVNYTLPESLLGLELEVENAGLNLDSVRAAGDARRVREAAELKSVQAEYALATEQLKNWDQQIANGILRAPGPGLVVYGRFDWDEPVYEGMEVRERQEIVILPDISTMMVDIKVPESQIGKLAEGQRASLQVDAFPNRVFTGRVTRVARLPEPGRRSQELKVYITSVLIDGTNEDGSLRPGMNAAVTIEVGTIPGVLNVPLAALERKGDTHYVWKVAPGGPVATPVELGANNLTHVEVVAGLSEGDRVYLVRPLGVRLPGMEKDEGREAPPEEPDLEAARSAGAPEDAVPGVGGSGS